MKNGDGDSRDLFLIVARTIYQITSDKSYEYGQILTPEDVLVEIFYTAGKKKAKRLRRCAWRVLQLLNQEYPCVPWAIKYLGDDKCQGTEWWRRDNEKTAVVTENINANLQLVHEPRIQSFRKALTDGGSGQLLMGDGRG